MVSYMKTGLVIWFTSSCLFDFVTSLSEIRHLTGNPDYRYVTLKWEYDTETPHLYGFQVHYCELQAWGTHRCRAKSYENGSINEATSKLRKSRIYSVIISGLRMSTNYSFEVRPVASRRLDREYHDPKTSKTVFVSTKGFSAKTNLCLPQESEIEVATGPYFGGRIAVEAADGERCTLDGDPNSPRDIYTLRINHDVCGSRVNETTVSTFVLVQENLPILTHSTRRFLVLCTYQPDTLTVRAKISLPSGPGRNYHDDEHQNENRVDVERHTQILPADVELQDESGNEVKVSKLRQERFNVNEEHLNTVREEPVVQFTLMMILVTSGIVGFLFVTWWSLKGRSNSIPDDEPTSNCENCARETEPSEINFEIESVCEFGSDASSTNQSNCLEAVNISVISKNSLSDISLARVHI